MNLHSIDNFYEKKSRRIFSSRPTRTKSAVAVGTLTIFLSLQAFAQTFQKEVILKGLDIPWSIEFLSSDQIIFTEKNGKLTIYDLKKKNKIPVKNLPQSHVHGQGGLLDLALHPQFEKNKLLYLSYSKKVDGGYTTAVASARLNKNALTELKDIFVANNPSSKGQHFGSRITFDENNFLFFSVGDRGSRDLAQKLSADQGKIHRISVDGSIPKDNPFYNTKGARQSIWSYGHRNPQGLVYDLKSKILWEQEHGPRGGDEINIIIKGKNYGWPVITYGKEYWGPSIGDTHKAGMEQPIHYYSPSIAPSGLEVYRASKFPKWEGNLFSGALVLTHINRLELDKNHKKVVNQERLLKDYNQRIRDIRQSPDGYLYFSTDSGTIERLVPAN